MMNDTHRTVQSSTNGAIDQNHKSRWSTNKFNRLLSNLERSILGQFNGNINGNSNRANSEKSNLIAHQACAKRQVLDNHSVNEVSASLKNVPKVNQSAMERNESQRIERPEQSDIRGKFTSTVKPSAGSKVIASDSPRKLTLNKCQPQSAFATLKSSHHLATHKLTIPPPHANDEARNMNRGLLLGTGIQLNETQTDSTCVAPPPPAIFNRGLCADKSQHDYTSTCRINSSPASSAKSLPESTQRTTAHLAKAIDGKGVRTLDNEEDDSGFSNYHSRRPFTVDHQAQNPQIENSLEDIKDQGNKMLIRSHLKQQPYKMSSSSGDSFRHPGQQIVHYNIHPFQHNIYPQNIIMLQNNTEQRTLPIVLTNNQAPTQPVHYNYKRLNRGSPNQTDPHLLNQHMYPSNQMMTQVRLSNMFDGNHSTHVQRFIDRQGFIDNGHAPPKPRRYQYYNIQPDGIIVPSLNVTPPNVIAPQFINSHTSNDNRFFTNQASYNYQNYPRFQYSPQNLGSEQPLNHAGTNTVTPNLATRIGYMPRHQDMQFNQGYQVNLEQQKFQHTEPPGFAGFPMVRSKSNLDAGYLTHVRNSGQTVLQKSTNLQPAARLSMDASNSEQRSLFNPIAISGGGLQRSKSVTHLLPEEDPIKMNHGNLISSNQANMKILPLIPISSASTNQLNLLGVDRTGPNLSRDNQSMKSEEPIYSNGPLKQHQTLMHWAVDQRQRNLPLNQQLNKAKSTTVLNLAHKAIRHSTGNHLMSQEIDTFAKPSLDDQIKHLLIEGRDCINPQISNVGHNRNLAIENSHDNNTIDRMLSPDKKINQIQSPSSTQVLTQTLPSWVNSSGDSPAHVSTIHPIQRQSYESDQKFVTSSSSFVKTNNNLQSNRNQIGSLTQQVSPTGSRLSNGITSSASEVRFNMGNRHQRQYQVQHFDSSQPRREDNINRRPGEANSQLIVDLTTPRVLARTQTKLVASGSQPWSMNQLGLPQIGTERVCSSLNEEDDRQDSIEQNSPKETVSLDKGEDQKQSDSERSAPYYYSDLKSEEQRRALLNIVQQKSLSPPPQLLSRSVDQSSTRLASKSSSTNSIQAKASSDSNMKRQEQQNTKNSPDMAKFDEDFIEFASNDNQVHRSQFEASQFSVSDFNASTSTSESSTSGVASDSMNSLLSGNNNHPKSSDEKLDNSGKLNMNYKCDAADKVSTYCKARDPSQPNKNANMYEMSSEKNCLFDINIVNDPTIADEPSEKKSEDSEELCEKNKRIRDDIRRREAIIGLERFKNVLGNVIDVDICPVNNLSQCSPVKNQA